MRSIAIHLVNTTRDAVRAHLTQFAEREGGDRWRYPLKVALPSLYIEFYEDYECELDADALSKLTLILGGMPDVSVIANVSGRVPGDDEVRAFAKSLLGTFRGVARDDYSGHCWTYAEIISGAKHGGHGFFDYEGWAQDKSAS